VSLRERFFREIATLGLPVSENPLAVITEADLQPLPEPGQRYMRFMGMLGRPRDWSFRASFTGRFKVKSDAPWRRCVVWQYNTCIDITRTFFMQMNFAGLPVIGRDTYRDGHGRMLGKVLDLFTVIDGKGPEFDMSELTTFLNDMVMIAPSMLLATPVTWAAVDDRSFDLTLADQGIVVRARVFVDARGAPTNFETSDRYCDDPDNPKKLLRAPWSTPMDAYQEVDGRPTFTRGQATWKLPKGDLTYAEFDLVPESLAYNVRPGK
jgi:hypothetical protein